jgi:hypothetical protein
MDPVDQPVIHELIQLVISLHPQVIGCRLYLHREVDNLVNRGPIIVSLTLFDLHLR